MSPTATKKDATTVKKAIAAALVSIKDADKGQVEAVFATFNVKDKDGEVTLPGAFENGAAVVISAYGHGSWRGLMPVGRGIIKTTETQAILQGQFFLDTAAGLETFKTIKGVAELQEWSYAFEVLETGELTEPMRQAGVWRVLKKVRVFEVSPVLRGAGIDTETLDVKNEKPADGSVQEVKGATDAQLSDYRKEFEKFMKTGQRLDG